MIKKMMLFLSLLLFTIGGIASATPSGNQLVRCQDLVALVGTVFTWAGSAQSCSNNNAIITRATFVSWISNSGSCTATTDYVLLYQDMLNCKTGGSVAQQSSAADFQGATTYDDVHGICQQGGTNYTFSTPSGTAAVTTAHPVKFVPNGSNAAVTITLANGGTTYATWTIPANNSSTYQLTSGPAGTYTMTASGLTSYTCPTVGAGDKAFGTAYWWQ